MKKLLITQALALSLLIPASAAAQISYDAFMNLVAEYKKAGSGDADLIIQEYNASRKKWAAGQQERAKKAFDDLKNENVFKAKFTAYIATKYKDIAKDTATLQNEIAALKAASTGKAKQTDLDDALAKIKTLETAAAKLENEKKAAEQAKTQSATQVTQLTADLNKVQQDLAKLKTELETARTDLLQANLPQAIVDAKAKRTEIATKLQAQIAKFDIATANESNLKDKAGYLALKQDVQNALNNLIAEAALDNATKDTIAGLVQQLEAASNKLQADFTDAKIAALKEMRDMMKITDAQQKLNTLKTNIKDKLALFNLSLVEKNNLLDKNKYENENNKLLTAQINANKLNIADDIQDDALTQNLQTITDLQKIHDGINFAEISRKKPEAKPKKDLTKDDWKALDVSSKTKAKTEAQKLIDATKTVADADKEALTDKINAAIEQLDAKINDEKTLIDNLETAAAALA